MTAAELGLHWPCRTPVHGPGPLNEGPSGKSGFKYRESRNAGRWVSRGESCALGVGAALHPQPWGR